MGWMFPRNGREIFGKNDGKSPLIVSFPMKNGEDISSMGDLQDPIDWRYLPYIFGLFFRPIFQGISP